MRFKRTAILQAVCFPNINAPTGTFETGGFLFNVVGDTGVTATVGLGDSLIFESSTLDITVTPGSAIVTIEDPNPVGHTGPTGVTGADGATGVTGPEGPSIGSLIPYSESYLYLSISGPSENFVSDNYYFIVPVDAILDEFPMSVQIFSYFIEPGTTGQVSYNIYTAPFDNSTSTLISTGTFSPDITDALPNDSFLTANPTLNIPISATTRVAVALFYSVDDATLSNLNVSFYGGLTLKPQ